jgi:hypothetical protein
MHVEVIRLPYILRGDEGDVGMNMKRAVFMGLLNYSVPSNLSQLLEGLEHYLLGQASLWVGEEELGGVEAEHGLAMRRLNACNIIIIRV